MLLDTARKLLKVLGEISNDGAVRTIVGKLREGSGEATKPIFEFFMQALTDANGILDLRTGAVKSGATQMLEQILHSLGEILSSVEIPQMLGVFKKDEDGKVYLSYELALEMLENFKRIEKSLETVPNKLGEYKTESLKFIRAFSKILQKYVDLFDIFIEGNALVRFFKRLGPSYDKVLRVRKGMKKCLMDLKKCLDAYEMNKYTFTAIRKKLFYEETGITADGELGETIAEAMAFNVFKEACTLCGVFKDDIVAWKKKAEKEAKEANKESADEINTRFYAILRSSPDLNNDVKVRLENALQFTQGLSPQRYLEIADAKELTEGNKSEVKQCQGWKLCKIKADDVVKTFKDKKYIDVQNMKIGEPQVGDYAIKILNCVNFTLTNLNKVVYLGEKLDRNGEGEEKSIKLTSPNRINDRAVDFDLIKLIGSGDGKKLDEIKVRQAKLELKVQQNSVSDAIKLFRECEKLYKKVNDLYGRYTRGDIHHIKDLDKNVVIPSASAETGEKKVNLDDRFNELEEIYNKITKDKQTKDWPLLLLRKGEKFKKAVNQWLKDLERKKKIAEKEIRDRKAIILAELKDAKTHYNMLKKLMTEKENQKKLKKFYDMIPKNPDKFIANNPKSEENLKRIMDIENEDDLRVMPLVRS